MASRGVSRVKAGYWFCGPNFLIRPPTDLPIELFTHLYAGFAEVNSDGSVTIPSSYSDRFQDFTRTVRERSNRRVKTLLSIGGEGYDISPVAMDLNKRAKFIQTSISVARSFGFDGLDLCSLYPTPTPTPSPQNVLPQPCPPIGQIIVLPQSCPQIGQINVCPQQYPQPLQCSSLDILLGEWNQAVRNEAEGDRLLLTAAVFHHPVIPGKDGCNNFWYPCKAISDNLNWINVLAINFYTPSNSPTLTGPVHAWSNHTDRNRCGRSGIEEWIKNGVPAKKLVLALPFSGYEWNLTNQNDENGLFAEAYPAHKDYKNIHAFVSKRNTEYTTNHVGSYVATYSQNERSWVGYDDERCITRKVSEAIGEKHINLRGCFAWHVGADDETWTLSNAAFGKDANWPAGDL
ncbi:class V chitinase-like [Carya illinoinensis]|uniref:GH18 domain-containing protein n=1 Tax=Carya illinoinensis TaxID=32201 RepID=A0A8T1NEF9_CARIL|nr:class V chitinase-like [Carya illinoinensis]KAG6628037.1 hypothetical protein CIPAW_15G172400 [Carya illinoinensis]KAG6628038.1 hypothetical protein CIPAW_15G172400 [Carya illinoinensis]KAG6676600.1 hypothetical protein I3842_15G159900 [Carya illinoinensis]